MTATVHVLGVRHHGPGSARAVAGALEELQPVAVVIEGAPELDAVAALAGSSEMVPPVAGLVYAPDEPGKAVFYPMASFSPEWVALRWALAAGRPVRFADLPVANGLGPEGFSGKGSKGPAWLRDDPIGALATAAGYDDAELWWEDTIEHRHNPVTVFAEVAEAMAELRVADAAAGAEDDEHNSRREAAMRRVLRAVVAEADGPVVVVCGAWHAPALHPDTWPAAAADAKLLKGLPRRKVAATWVPFTAGRLARASGYGAGITAPGWYAHLFETPDNRAYGSSPGGSSLDGRGPLPQPTPASPAVTKFAVRAAGLLRTEGFDAPPSSVTDAVRLAGALAVLRGRPAPGTPELMDALQAALAGGSDVPLRLIGARLLVGDDLGSVPPETPMVPLARDLAALQKRLRLPAAAGVKEIEVDLRTDTGLERSGLLHRLRLLGVDWGEPIETGRTKGTFKEGWALQWRPEHAVILLEASRLGATVEEAAGAALGEAAADAADLAVLAELTEAALTAGLPAALRAVTDALAERAAHQHDTARLMAAVEPLARTRRYGNVRRVDTEAVAHVLGEVVVRVTVGLPAACASLDDDAAETMHDLIDSVGRGVALVDDAELRARWLDSLGSLADRQTHGLVAGRAVRLLLDAGRIEGSDARRRLGLALSRAADAQQGANWLNGFVAGDAALLLADRELLDVIDGWLTDVGPFDEILPLLRRGFSRFGPAERRSIGAAVRTTGSATPRPTPSADDTLHPDRAAAVLPRLYELLGLQP